MRAESKVYCSVISKEPTFDLTCSGRSLVYTRKRTGPITEPCRMPEKTGMKSVEVCGPDKINLDHLNI